MKKLFSLLALALVLGAMTVVSSCSSEDDSTSNQNIYTLGLTSVATSSTEEMQTIYDAFHQSVGSSESYITLEGSTSKCDSQMKSSCQAAESKLSGKTFKGKYTMDCSRVTAKGNVTIYNHTFGN